MRIKDIPANEIDPTFSAETSLIKTPQVAIIVLNWNAWAVTGQALDAINYLEYPNHEVILVDNGSSCPPPLEFKEKFANLTFVQTGRNLGYTGGNNVGIHVALERHADYILILNNDVLIKDSELLSKLVSAARNSPSTGIFAPQVIQYNQDGEVIRDQYKGRAQDLLSLLKCTTKSCNSDSTAIPDQPRQMQCATNDVTNVTQVCGCAMFISRAFLEQVGFFDERLFMYDDEYDLCLRGIDAGFLIQQVNSASVSRLNVCSQSNMPSYRTYLYGRNRFLLARKRTRFTHSAVFLFLHLISSSRLALTLLRHRRFHQLSSLIRGFIDGILCRWGSTPILRTLLKPS